MLKHAIHLCLLFLSCLCISFSAQAQDQTNTQNIIRFETSLLGQLPILHEGRVKPLDSFARAKLKIFSRDDTDAMPWLIEVLFDPVRAETRRVLRVNNPEVRSLLHLEKRNDKLYSYNEVSAGMLPRQEMLRQIAQINEEDWTTQQSDLILLQEKLALFQDMLSSLTLFLPLSIPPSEGLANSLNIEPSKTLSYLDIDQGLLTKHVRDIIAHKGEDIERYDHDEQILAHLSFTLNVLKKNSMQHRIFTVLYDAERGWISPWTVVHDGVPHKPKSFAMWQDLSIAYHTGDTTRWHTALVELHQKAYSTPHSNMRKNAVITEYYYNSVHPFVISFIVSLGALSLLFITLFRDNKLLVRLSTFLITASLVIQCTGLGLRMYILERPPVSTLYETVLFVCCVVTLYMLIVFHKNRKILWLWLVCLLNVFLHMLGFSHDQDGDSFLMLSAVLNTNFWLSTHVLCITSGYAFCVITSALAHYALIKMAYRGEDVPDGSILQNIHSAALLSLLFCGVGTVLGGIWADQSWGRFWGWDPKENGALLIVLWLAWVIHGRISSQLSIRGVLYGHCLLSIILALSWFGVNLLGIGLHAYGFSDATIWGMVLFAIIEVAFVLFMMFLFYTNRKKRNHA